MIFLLSALSALSSAPASLAIAPLAAPVEDPPVRVWMSNDRRYREGDRVRLQVDTDVGGYLLVLNYDPTGRLRVLFPLDPRDDARVEAGRRYEVRGEGTDVAFRAGGDGTGMIYAAVAEEPWRFDEVVSNDRWDYGRLEVDRTTTDAEPDITELVQRMAGERGFDYDVLGYRVYGESTVASYTTHIYPGGPIYVHDDYLFCNNWNWRYDGCRRWPYDGGWSFGIGFYYPRYYGYSPYRYGYYPYGYRYGYGYGYGYPYFPRPSFPGTRPVLVGRPRGYSVVPRGTLASGSRGTYTGGGFGGSVSGPSRRAGDDRITSPSDRPRARGPARRAGDGTVREPGSTSRGPEASGRSPGSSRSPEASGRSPGSSRPSSPPARRSRGGSNEERYAAPARGSDRYQPSRGSEAAPRTEPVRRDVYRSRGEPSRREAPPARVENPRRDNPPSARSEPSRRESPPARSEPRRESAPRSEPSRRDPPRAQAQGGGDRGGGNGGARSRGRRP
jgi:hypothetical protein